jgi:hypothetical protein
MLDICRSHIAMQEIARTNQNPKDEWRGGGPPPHFLGVCDNQILHCHTFGYNTLR